MMEINPYEEAHHAAKQTLVIHGSTDEVIPADCAKRLTQELPHAQLALIDGADHCFDDRHEEMASAAISFLRLLNR
jgi:pimeloyl-ACP methyl ester carboxylesterase